MKRNSEFENILDDCLERLAKGETLEQCLQSYPEQAAQLEPLLQTAQIVRKASAIFPRSEFKARARYQFRSALQIAASERRPHLFGWRSRRALALMITAIFLIAGGGTAAAASSSMPDSHLYSVKLATEQAQLTLTRSDVGKARLCAVMADRRVKEIIYLAGKGDVQRVEVVTQRLDKHLAQLARLGSARKAGDTPEVLAPLPPPEPSEKPRDGKDAFVRGNDRAKLRGTVAHCAANHPAALRAALRKAPESAKPALRQAIAISEAGYDRALEALD